MLPVLLLFNSEKGGGSFHINLICDIFLESGGIINETPNRQSDKGPCCQTVFFLVVIYRCKSWTTKKVEH